MILKIEVNNFFRICYAESKPEKKNGFLREERPNSKPCDYQNFTSGKHHDWSP